MVVIPSGRGMSSNKKKEDLYLDLIKVVIPSGRGMSSNHLTKSGFLRNWKSRNPLWSGHVFKPGR